MGARRRKVIIFNPHKKKQSPTDSTSSVGSIFKNTLKKRKNTLKITENKTMMNHNTNETFKKLKKLQLLLQIGTTHWINTSSGKRLADIIDVRPDSKNAHLNEYYVHYREFDKRLDEWIPMDKFVISNDIEPQQIPLSEAGTLTRNLRRKMLSTLAPSPSSSPSPISILSAAPAVLDSEYEKLEREHEEATKVKNIQKIEIGQWEIDCWYFSPYPDEYCHVDKLYVCEKCLKYMKYPESLVKHEPVCPYIGPPGKLIYLKDNIAVYELDGEKEGEKLYCQNISLMAKLFLDHKTLYYDVGPFMFYVVCDVSKENSTDREEKIHPVGYFSKEKESPDNYNLACIMILPPYQRHGFGRFLIELSYELSKRENKTGSPEKPLSDLGLVSYRSFWTQILLESIKAFYLKKKEYPLISELLKMTSIIKNEIIETLCLVNLTKLWRGEFILNIDSIKVVDDLLKKYHSRQQIRVNPDFLAWPQDKKNLVNKK